MIELWKSVPGYGGRYLVSNQGRVFSLKRRQHLKPLTSPNGYARVRLYDGKGGSALLWLHRIVAQAFIPNPEAKPQVNHKDGVKLRNVWTNLEWATRSENQRHRFDVLGKRKTTGRAVVCVESGVVYPTATAAAEALGLNRPAVTMCCRGQREHTNKLHFKYMEE